MKKTLLATAIAGALAASGAQAATVYNQDGTKLDLYGNIQIAYYNTNDAAGESEDEIADNGSTLGVAGEHVISEGLAGYFKYEFEGDADEIKAGNGLDTGDQAYVGLKGNFGDVRLGSYDPLIDDWIQDPITNNEGFDVSDSSSLGIANVGTNDREGDKVTFTSPSFSGLQFAVGTQYKGDAEENEFSGTLGSDISHTVEPDSNASFFGGAKYTSGAFSIAAVYDNLDNYDGTVTGVKVRNSDNTVTSTDLSADPIEFELGDQYGVTAQYTFDTLRIAVKYERFETDNDIIEDHDFYALGARYGYGNGDIYAAYQYVDVGGEGIRSLGSDALDPDEDVDLGDDNYNEVIVGANYNVSDAMYVWSEYRMMDRENDALDGVGVGVTYLF